MLLLIDIGNSNIVCGVMENGTLRLSVRMKTLPARPAEEYVVFLRDMLTENHISVSQIQDAVISSVVPVVAEAINLAWKEMSGRETQMIDITWETGLIFDLYSPEKLGCDMVVGAAAGVAEYPLPLVLIDVGTATTVCVINQDKIFTGYMIIPGPTTGLKGLLARTAQLPHIPLETPKRMLGKNTKESMQSGIFYAHACMLDGILDRLSEELETEDISVVLTGGISRKILPLMKHSANFDPALLLKGMWHMYEEHMRPSRQPEEKGTIGKS